MPIKNPGDKCSSNETTVTHFEQVSFNSDHQFIH